MNKIYKRTSTGAIQQWQIFVDGDSFHTEEGQVGGKITQNKPTVCKPKNVGRANETTATEQAYKQAQAKWKKKCESGYTEDITAVDSAVTFFKPMLAAKYDDYKDKLVFPCFIQPKLDGIRCIIRKDGAWTRNGKQHMCIPHILEELESLFEKYPNMILDGELFNMELHDDFNKIASLIKKTKPTQKALDESKNLVQFHCYDVPQFSDTNQNDTFMHRQKIFWGEVEDTEFKYLIRVESDVARDQEDVTTYHEKFVGEGYEGAIIRVNAGYVNKRSKSLLKLKHFFDDEFVLLDLREGNGNSSGVAAHADFKTKDGKPFTANIKGNMEFKRQLLINKKSYIGKQGTVRYPNLTPAGIPRFPYLYGIRDYE